MVEATLDDGLTVRALNEVFVGHRSHQSARYRIRLGTQEERQSSWGLIVATGTGATGWALSINRERRAGLELPGPAEPRLAYFVREAWPSPATGVYLTEGLLERDETLEVASEMGDGGVIFGGGIEADLVEFSCGTRATIRVAEGRLLLVVGWARLPFVVLTASKDVDPREKRRGRAIEGDRFRKDGRRALQKSPDGFRNDVVHLAGSARPNSDVLLAGSRRRCR